MSGYAQTNQKISLPDANYTVSSADSGKIFTISTLGADRTVTLPSAQSGLYYTFVNVSPATLTHDLNITTPETNNMSGTVINTAALNAVDPFVYTTVTPLSFDSTSVIGDIMECYCDGVEWYVSGISGVAAGFA